MLKNKEKIRNKKQQDGPTVIELNLSLTVGIVGAIIAIIVAITTVKVITTMIQANENKNAANESDINQYATYVTSTTKNESGNIVEDKDSNGNVIKIPVPKGYTASQIDGETSLNKGFVIYEGDVDWSSVLVNGQSTKSAGTQSTNSTKSIITQSTTMSTESTKAIEIQSTNSTKSTNTESTTENTKSPNTQNTTASTENIDKLKAEKSSSVIANTHISESTSSTENTKNEKENKITETTKKEESNNVTEAPQQNATSSTTTSTKSTKKEEIIEENKVTTSTEEKINDINVENTTEETVNTVEVEDDTTDDTSTTDSTELTLEEQQTKNIFDLQEERNQYVWVPVSDPSRIYGVDANGKVWGKLYNFSSSGKSNRDWTETNRIMSITDTTGYREPGVAWYASTNSAYVFDTDGYSYMHRYGLGETRYELLAQELEQNYLEIIKSIKKYGGFYIGRYELGYENNTTPVVKKMNTSNDRINWYKGYRGCLALKGNNNNIKTMMITGSLWDETVDWLVSSGATNSEGTTLTYQLVGNDSTTFGNYIDATFKYIAKDAKMPTATEIKEAADNFQKGVLIPTGSAEYTKTNNIYDMAGNVSEWTTEVHFSEAYSIYERGLRGGIYYYNRQLQSSGVLYLCRFG